jgi:hypothetical protein
MLHRILPSIFFHCVDLRRAIGAAYTPIAVGRDGKIYTENDGDVFVEGK